MMFQVRVITGTTNYIETKSVLKEDKIRVLNENFNQICKRRYFEENLYQHILRLFNQNLSRSEFFLKNKILI